MRSLFNGEIDAQKILKPFAPVVERQNSDRVLKPCQSYLSLKFLNTGLYLRLPGGTDKPVCPCDIFQTIATKSMSAGKQRHHGLRFIRVGL
ncbi:MAG: hypothetical protein OZ917_01255 [Candidatus Brocadiaceae bacterium]|nr:hypothetical protein [Candidatus Brocadiaceae bacterium]